MDSLDTPISQPELRDQNPNEITEFAETNFRNERRRFGIKRDDRRRHMYLIGKTGMGKTTLQENMIIQDIRNGNGVCVVDPHGDLVEKVIQFIPSNRINDTIYFNPADHEFPIAFNILESVRPELRHLVSNGLVGVFKKIWADSWGPRLEYILINAILALLEYPGSTLLGVTRILVDDHFRKKVVNNISDPVVKSFWVNEYNNYSEKFRNEAIAPIQNKVGQFLSSSLIRNIVGQPKSRINLREVMDHRQILLLNLAKGRIGEENSALLGAMMITKMQLAVMSRADIPELQRQDFYLYVDEFQNFATDSFANILSEARKYRLNLILAHQYVEQLSDLVKAAVFGNAGTIVAFRVGGIDAEELEKEFQPTFMQEHLVTLGKYNVYLRLMIDGVASEPFSATTFPPVSGETDNRQKIIRVSRERYSGQRKEVEEKILRWSGMDEESLADAQEQQAQKSPQREERREWQPRQQGQRDWQPPQRADKRPPRWDRPPQQRRDSYDQPMRRSPAPASRVSLSIPRPSVSAPTKPASVQPAAPSPVTPMPQAPQQSPQAAEHKKRRRRRSRGKKDGAQQSPI